MSSHERDGFTIMEVLVALALSTLVLLSAREILEALGRHAQGVVRVARVVDGHANAEAEVHQVVRDLVVPREAVPSVTGNEDSTAFRSYCFSHLGWQEQCDVQLVVERAGARYRVNLHQKAEEPIVLGDDLRLAGIRYLVAANAGGQWTSHWESTLMVPQAIGVILDRDTLVLRVGERR
jgi:prepilin-type N-terminal cleavage/methylation domain-containing protein